MDQRDIITVTLNPALDLATKATDVRPGPKLRCAAPRTDPGGGGINVSRAIRILGGQSRALVALGGATGQTIADLLKVEGIQPELLTAPGDTRQSLAVTDRKTGHQFRFVMPGPDWDAAHTVAAHQACVDAAAPGTWVVLSGSQPPGVPDGFARDLAATLKARGVSLVVDTSGAALRDLTSNPDPANAPALVRFDSVEACELSGEKLVAPAKVGDFAATLVEQGVADAVIIACGSDGSVLATAEDGIIHCRAARVPVLSKIGAGDSFVGAAVLWLTQGRSIVEALHYGTAAACSAVMTPATRLCTAEDTERLLPECHIRTLRRPQS